VVPPAQETAGGAAPTAPGLCAPDGVPATCASRDPVSRDRRATQEKAMVGVMHMHRPGSGS